VVLRDGIISAGRFALLVATVLLVNYGAKQRLYNDKGQRLFVMGIAVSANIALLFLTTTRAERTAMWQKGPKS
jgi:hypothetical protein